jgi:colanic acid biosynthesis glycosyl transferase WcaI
MKKERILLLGGNYFPEPTGIGKYSAEMMNWLSTQNCECGVVTTYPYYPYWKIQSPYVNKSAWYSKELQQTGSNSSITVYRCPHYVPSIPTGMKRMLSDLSFFLSAFFQVLRLLFRKKYDYVLVVAPPFQIGLLGYLYKKIKGATLIYHIQDLQIDAAVDLGMIKSAFLIRSMFGLERFILRKADIVSSISEGMIGRIKAKYERPVVLFPNWADTKAFYPIHNKEVLKLQFDFLPSDKIVLYSGAIGEKQGLQTLLKSAAALQSFSYIKFVICGSGPYKERLTKMAKELRLNNVHFMPLQPTAVFNEFLNMADVHLVLQKANDNELFLPSKLTTICAAGGLVIVTANEKTSLHSLVSTNKLGLLIAPENTADLTDAIKKAIYQDHEALKDSARTYAANYLSIEKIVSKYFLFIQSHKKPSPQSVIIEELEVERTNIHPLHRTVKRIGITGNSK